MRIVRLVMLDISQLSLCCDQYKTKSLATQKDRHVLRHEQVIAKLTERFDFKLADNLKSLENKIQSTLKENENLKKKVSLLERERHFLEAEKKRPAVFSSLKVIQKEPMDLSSKEETLPQLLPYLDKLRMLCEAGGLQPH